MFILFLNKHYVHLVVKLNSVISKKLYGVERNCSLFIQPSSKFYYLSNVVVSATGNQGVKFKTKVVLLRSQGEN